MSLSIVVNGGGTFTASMEEGPVSFTASLAAVGPKGDTGPGVAVGGTTGQVLAKASGTNYDTQWVARNPFDQSLNTTEPVSFESVTVSDGIDTLSIEGSRISFPDSTQQFTALPTGTADGYIVAWNADTSAYDSVPNDARTLFLNGTNKTGTTIAKGKAVYISGATGNHPEITLAQANSESTSAKTIGITSEAIANNGTGRVIVAGLLENVDTSAFTAGNVLYLSSSSAGGFQTTLPTQPNHGVLLGYVVRSNANNGVIEVRVDNYQELGEQSDVLLTSKTNLDLLSYETSSGLWKNKSFSTLGLLTSATAASTYLTISTAASTYSPIASPTFTGTVTIPAGASISGFATLSSPALSGTPTAPTAAATTNTTQVATTAFVQQEVPAASTTAAGKVELATAAEAVAGTSATLAVTPSGIYLNTVSPGMGLLPGNASNGITSGTGAASNASMFGITCFGPDSGVVGYGGRRFQMNNGQIGSLEQGWGVVDFDKRISLSFRIAPQLVSSGSPHNDSVVNVNYGDLLGTDAGGTLARKGFGIQIYGHDNPLRLTVHDGTTYRTVDSSFTPVSTTTASAVDFLLVSEAGTVTLYNRTTRTSAWTQIATSANGPTGLSASNASSVTCTSRNESVSVTSVRWRAIAGFFSVEY